ncbi:hypothetical protein [Anaerolentibacter hominis]|uniref:hypothetical protein n=1 Tax=Anaerolentibacter hominis TaxID=3079009 RepID=UPI0031B88D2D
MITIILDKNGPVSGLVKKADLVDYDNTASGMAATNVQDAVDELKADSHSHENINVLSGITSEKVKQWDEKNDNSIELTSKVTELSTEISSINTEVTVLKNTISVKENKPEYIEYTLLSSGWSGSSTPYAYNLSTTYPSASNDIEIILNGASTTAEQYKVVADAKIVGSSDNNLYAFGSKPAINIPIVIRRYSK